MQADREDIAVSKHSSFDHLDRAHCPRNSRGWLPSQEHEKQIENMNGAQAVASLPWVEKYRSIKIDEIVGNKDAVERLAAIASTGNMPNLIFTRSTWHREDNFRPLPRTRASGPFIQGRSPRAERIRRPGIDVVRNKIKMFAQKKVTLLLADIRLSCSTRPTGVTSAAQQALRRTLLELYSTTTRFALACNASEKIIEPIQSRCAIVRFTRLSDQEVLERVVKVVPMEEVPFWSLTAWRLSSFTADGDMRQALNNLQATHSGFGFVNQANVFKVCDQPHPEIVVDFKIALPSALCRSPLTTR